ncbi:mariner transposase [Trichonephila clavipes]|nr:mariner transposase [Trichonephila clavipes]
MMDRISICEALSKRNEIDSFLKRMVAGDEKWVTYYTILCENNHGQSAVKELKWWSNQKLTARKGSTVFAGQERNQSCFPHDQTLTSDFYCQQLDRSKLTIDQKWPELANRRGVLCFHENNPQGYTCLYWTARNSGSLVGKFLMHLP